MASSYKDNVSNMNISTGVKSKLHKWLGKASANVRDKRPRKEISAEIMDYDSAKVDVTTNLTPQHSRSRSAPISTPDAERGLKKRRKASVNVPPISIPKEGILRENDKNDSYTRNKTTQVFITHSEPLHESSSVPSGVQLQRRNVSDNLVKQTILGDQTGIIGPNVNGRADKALMNGMNGYTSTREVTGTRARTNRGAFARRISKTSVDLSEQDESAGNDGMVSAISLDSIPQNVHQLSGQIQSRLQMWVERASYLVAGRDRRHSEESASSTDDSSSTPDSCRSQAPGSENESQVKKIKELELALKELVENVGVRGGSWPSKLQDTSLNSPGSSSRNRSRKNSDEYGSDRQVFGEFNKNEKDGVIEKESRDARQWISREIRNSSSSSSDSDTVMKVTDTFDSHPKDDDEEDFDGVIFMKLSNPTQDVPAIHSPRERKSVNLQDVLISETLIEDKPRRGENDNAKKVRAKNQFKRSRDETALQKRASEECLSEVAGNKNRSCKMISSEVQNEKENYNEVLFENKLSSKNGVGKKLDRPRLRSRAMSSDAASLTVGSGLAVRESMRHYLNFKDADLSAFAVECVRHANKKKQIIREEHQAEVKTTTQKTFVDTEDSQVVGTREQKPAVLISSQDNNHKTDIANGLDEKPKVQHDEQSSGTVVNSETEEPTIEKELSSNSQNSVFARTAEEAEQILASTPTRKESLERSSSNPQREFGNTSQRLYKFPSMPMFYIPNGNEESESRREKKEKRKSATTYPYALNELASTGSDPFYHGQTGSKTKLKTYHSRSTSNLICNLDENGNETSEKPKSSPRPKMQRRKASAPTSSSLLSMTSTVRVDIEAHI